MLSGVSLASLFLLATASALTPGQHCQCWALPSAGLQVNCSSSGLVELPRLPPDTKQLHVQNNRLTSVSPGQFDRLVGLERASLSGNPFHCDCRIQYLRNWLLKNRDVVSEQPTCASPSSVAHKAIADLGDDFFSPYAPARCTDGTFNIVMGAMLGCLVLLLLWCLRLAKEATIIVSIDERHSGFQADSLRSLRPKHRRRLYAGLSEVSHDSSSITYADDLEKPLMNMELLPQVLDVLHKKHNIKIL